MKITLLQCPGWGRDCPPYALALLSACLRSRGHKVYSFDLNNALYSSGPDKYRKMWDDKDLYHFWSDKILLSQFIKDNERMLDFQADQILGSESTIIGFTVHFTSLLISLEVARRIKAKAQDRIIVFGGPECCRELRGLNIINEDNVDAVVIGEGEITLLELVDIVKKKGKVDFCPGILFKKEGKVIDCGDRRIIENLDLLPFPDYSDFRDDIRLGHYRQPKRLEILDSRGCVTKCHFCSEWQFWKKFRSMNGERIFEEAAYQLKRNPGISYFYFIGSLLNGNIRALSVFCDLLIRNNLKIKWAGQAVIRPEMTAELLERMHSAGCEWLGYGIESGSQKVVNNMNKRFSIVDAERVLADTHRAGISTQANFMFGIPTETRDDFKQTLEFLQRNRENIDSVLASQSFCVIDKGAYLYTHAQEFGIRNVEHHLYWEIDNNDYPERFNRYEEFCRLALSLGLPETSGVLRFKPDKWLLLGEYYQYKKDYPRADKLFQKAKESESLVSERKVLQDGNGDDIFDEKQKKLIEALKKAGLTRKMDNYIRIERQKLNRDEFVEGYPYWLTIDPANFCNLKCPFCPTGQGRNSRPKGMLNFENFKTVMDEMGPYLIHIDFCNWGEPLLNKDIYEFIKYAKQYRIDTKIDSNLNVLSESDAEKMILSGLDKLIVSIDGASPETYSKYRVNGDFAKVMNNLELLIQKRKVLNRSNPYICWQFLVFRHNEHEIDMAKKIGSDLGVDTVDITKAFIGSKEWMPLNEKYSHYRKEEILGEYTSKYFKPAADNFCNWPWEAITINPNGSVSPCCSIEDEKDDFGNIFRESFKNIWNNEKYIRARKYIKKRDVIQAKKDNNICVGCRHSGIINLDIRSLRCFYHQK